MEKIKFDLSQKTGEFKILNATNATKKLPISTAITPLRPIKEYNAVAASGFNIDINDLDNERNPLVF